MIATRRRPSTRARPILPLRPSLRSRPSATGPLAPALSGGVTRAATVATAAGAAAGAAAETAAVAAHRKTVPEWVALVRAERTIGVAILGLVGFGLIFAAVRARRSQAIDLALMLRLQRRRRPWLDRVMAAASWPGFPPQSRLIPPTIIGCLWIVRFRTEAAFETAAWGTALLSTGLKAVMDRPRPVAGQDLRVIAAPLGGTSFPSGHVITFVGVYGFLGSLTWTLVRDPVARLALTGSLLGLVALVGPSRVYQGHHWPTDVTASYLLGTSYVVVLAAGYRRVKAAQAGPATSALARAAIRTGIAGG